MPTERSLVSFRPPPFLYFWRSSENLSISAFRAFLKFLKAIITTVILSRDLSATADLRMASTEPPQFW